MGLCCYGLLCLGFVCLLILCLFVFHWFCCRFGVTERIVGLGLLVCFGAFVVFGWYVGLILSWVFG